MSSPEDGNTCPRCGNAFHCGAADARCDCFDLTLDEHLRMGLAQHYDRCLCMACLKACMAGAPIALAAPP